MSSLPNVKKPCAQCPFRKDTQKGWLGSDRVADIIRQSSFVCHKKTHLQCAGHMLLNGDKNQFVRLANKLNIELDLSGKELVFDSAQSCVAHHKI
jgi:uncharacterized protein DUF6283